MDVVEQYQEILSGKQKHFVKGTWSGEDRTERAVKCLKYLLEKKLKWNKEEVASSLNQQLLESYKLSSPLFTLFNGSVLAYLNMAYPGVYSEKRLGNRRYVITVQDQAPEPLSPLEQYKEILSGKRDRFAYYWYSPTGKEEAVKCLKHLLEEVLKWNDAKVASSFNKDIVEAYHLGEPCMALFGGWCFNYIDCAYPDRYQLSKFNRMGNLATRHSALEQYRYILKGRLSRFQMGVWRLPHSKDMADACLRYLIEDWLQWDEEMLKNKFSIKTIERNFLSSPLTIFYNSSAFDYLNSAYSEKYNPFQFKRLNPNSITREHVATEIKTRVNALGWSEDEIREFLTIKELIEGGVGTSINKLFNGNTLQAVHLAFQNLKGKSFRYLPTPTAKNSEEAADRLRHFIEKKLGWGRKEIEEHLNHRVFSEYGAESLVNDFFNGDVLKAVNAMYPGEFEAAEVKKAPKRNMSRKRLFNSLQVLLKEKKGWTRDECEKNLTMDLFREHGLYWNVSRQFTSLDALIDSVYGVPERPWEVRHDKEWDTSAIISAIKELVERKLKVPPQVAPYFLREAHFARHHMTPALKGGESMEELVSMAYPGIKISPPETICAMVFSGEIAYYPREFWERDMENRMGHVVRYILEEELGLSPEDIPRTFTTKFLQKYRLHEVGRKFGLSNHQMLEMAYPGKYQPCELRNATTYSMSRETALQAIEKELRDSGTPPEEWSNTINTQWFIKTALNRMRKYVTIQEARDYFRKMKK